MFRSLRSLIFSLALAPLVVCPKLGATPHDVSGNRFEIPPPRPQAPAVAESNYDREFTIPFERPGQFDVPFLEKLVAQAAAKPATAKDLLSALYPNEASKLAIGLSALSDRPETCQSVTDADWTAGRARLLEALPASTHGQWIGQQAMRVLPYLAVNQRELERKLKSPRLSDAEVRKLREDLDRAPAGLDLPGFPQSAWLDNRARVIKTLESLRPAAARAYYGDFARSENAAQLVERLDKLSPEGQIGLASALMRADGSTGLSGDEKNRLLGWIGERKKPLFDQLASRLGFRQSDRELRDALSGLTDVGASYLHDFLREDRGDASERRAAALLRVTHPGAADLASLRRAERDPRGAFNASARCEADDLESSWSPSPMRDSENNELPYFRDLIGTAEDRRLAAKQIAKKLSPDPENDPQRRLYSIYDTYTPSDGNAPSGTPLSEYLNYTFTPVFHRNMQRFALGFFESSEKSKRQFLVRLNETELAALLQGIRMMIRPGAIKGWERKSGPYGNLLWKPYLGLSAAQEKQLSRLEDILQREKWRREKARGRDSFGALLAEAKLRCVGKSPHLPPNLLRLKRSVAGDDHLSNALPLLSEEDKAFFWADFLQGKRRKASWGAFLTDRLDSLLARDPGTLDPVERKEREWAEKTIRNFVDQERAFFAAAARRDPKIAKKRIPWLEGKYDLFRPAIVFDDGGNATVRFIPTERLQDLQSRQALALGLIGAPNGPQAPIRYRRSDDYTGHAHPTTPEEAMLWYAQYGTRPPSTLMHVTSGSGGAVSDSGPLVAVALAMVPGLQGVALFGMRGLPAFTLRSAANLSLDAAFQHLSERLGPGAALASIPLVMLGSWAGGRALGAAASGAKRFASESTIRLLSPAAQKDLALAVNRLGLSVRESLALAVKMESTEASAAARLAHLLRQEPALAEELQRLPASMSAIRPLLESKGLGHLSEGEQSLLVQAMREGRARPLAEAMNSVLVKKLTPTAEAKAIAAEGSRDQGIILGDVHLRGKWTDGKWVPDASDANTASWRDTLEALASEARARKLHSVTFNGDLFNRKEFETMTRQQRIAAYRQIVGEIKTKLREADPQIKIFLNFGDHELPKVGIPIYLKGPDGKLSPQLEANGEPVQLGFKGKVLARSHANGDDQLDLKFARDVKEALEKAHPDVEILGIDPRLSKFYDPTGTGKQKVSLSHIQYGAGAGGKSSALERAHIAGLGGRVPTLGRVAPDAQAVEEAARSGKVIQVGGDSHAPFQDANRVNPGAAGAGGPKGTRAKSEIVPEVTVARVTPEGVRINELKEGRFVDWDVHQAARATSGAPDVGAAAPAGTALERPTPVDLVRAGRSLRRKGLNAEQAKTLLADEELTKTLQKAHEIGFRPGEVPRAPTFAELRQKRRIASEALEKSLRKLGLDSEEAARRAKAITDQLIRDGVLGESAPKVLSKATLPGSPEGSPTLGEAAALKRPRYGDDGELRYEHVDTMELVEKFPTLGKPPAAVRETYAMPPEEGTVNDLPQVQAKLSKLRLSSGGDAGGTGEAVLAEVLVDGKPRLVVAKRALNDFYRKQEGAAATARADFTEGRDLIVAHNLGIGPRYYGVTPEGYHIMDFVPGTFPTDQRAAKLITSATFKDLDRVTEKLMNAGFREGADFQYLVRATDGKVTVVDGLGAFKRDPVLGTPLDLKERIFLMEYAEENVSLSYLRELKATRPAVFQATVKKMKQGGTWKSILAQLGE